MSQRLLSRRNLLELTGVTALTAAWLPTALGCGDSASSDDDAAAREATAEELESEGPLHTLDKPGEWAGKEATHVPEVTIAGNKATVVVEHVMSNAHWITHLYLRDQDETVIALVELDGSEEEAKSTFTLPKGTTKVTAYAMCNLHGLWQSEPASV